MKPTPALKEQDTAIAARDAALGRVMVVAAGQREEVLGEAYASLWYDIATGQLDVPLTQWQFSELVTTAPEKSALLAAYCDVLILVTRYSIVTGRAKIAEGVRPSRKSFEILAKWGVYDSKKGAVIYTDANAIPQTHFYRINSFSFTSTF